MYSLHGGVAFHQSVPYPAPLVALTAPLWIVGGYDNPLKPFDELLDWVVGGRFLHFVISCDPAGLASPIALSKPSMRGI